MLTKLDIINQMLASTGTSPLTSNDTSHPFYLRGASKLDLVTRSVLAQGWWFNRRIVTLRPNTDGEVVLPSSALHADPVDTRKEIAIRGRKMFNLRTGSFNVGEDVKINFIESLDLSEIPSVAQDYIAARCVYEYYLDSGGVPMKVSEYRDARDAAWVALRGDNLRNTDTNWFSGLSSAQMRRGVRGRRLPLQDE